MRLKPISVLIICLDGLVPIEGLAFKVGSRELVVHKPRPAVLPVDDNYKISAVVGFSIPISPTRDRREAVHFASIEVPKISEHEWARRCEMAQEAKKNLKVVEG
jgi:hypothetical protein